MEIAVYQTHEAKEPIDSPDNHGWPQPVPVFEIFEDYCVTAELDVRPRDARKDVLETTHEGDNREDNVHDKKQLVCSMAHPCQRHGQEQQHHDHSLSVVQF